MFKKMHLDLIHDSCEYESLDIVINISLVCCESYMVLLIISSLMVKSQLATHLIIHPNKQIRDGEI